MLKLKYLYENFDLARKCMELYECDMDSVDEMLPYSDQRRNHKMLLEEIGERIQKYCSSEIVKKEYENVCVELDSLPLTSSDYGIIHYDFEPDNVFYDKKEEMFSVIDFDDTINCWYALDVARALDGLDEIVEADSIEEAITGFLEGYASATIFTVEQQRSMMLMRRLVRLQEYTTLYLNRYIKKCKYTKNSNGY